MDDVLIDLASLSCSFYLSLPPVCKAYGTLCFLTTVAYQLQLLNPEWIYLDFVLVTKKYQVRQELRFFWCDKARVLKFVLVWFLTLVLLESRRLDYEELQCMQVLGICGFRYFKTFLLLQWQSSQLMWLLIADMATVDQLLFPRGFLHTIWRPIIDDVSTKFFFASTYLYCRYLFESNVPISKRDLFYSELKYTEFHFTIYWEILVEGVVDYDHYVARSTLMPKFILSGVPRFVFLHGMTIHAYSVINFYIKCSKCRNDLSVIRLQSKIRSATRTGPIC